MANISKVCVVVPNWNGADLISDCLSSLESQTQRVNVIVVDNGSTDESVNLIKNKFPKVILLQNSKNLGFSGGVNVGIKYALAEGYDGVALFNNDAVADKEWLKHLVATMEQNATYGIVTGKLLRMKGQYLDSTGQNYTIWGAPFPRGRNQKDTGQFDTQTMVFGATGGATLYRANMLKEIGIFDERFFAYYEDDDLSFRARLSGWEVIYDPRAVAYHHVSATAAKLGKFTRYHATKNLMMTYLKNMPGLLFWKYLPLFIIWVILLAISSILRGGVLAYLKGFGQVLLNLPGLIHDRHRIQKQRKVPLKAIDQLLTRSFPPRFPKIPVEQ